MYGEGNEKRKVFNFGKANLGCFADQFYPTHDSPIFCASTVLLSFYSGKKSQRSQITGSIPNQAPKNVPDVMDHYSTKP